MLRAALAEREDWQQQANAWKDARDAALARVAEVEAQYAVCFEERQEAERKYYNCESSAAAERAAIVAWLRKGAWEAFARAIESGAHLAQRPGGPPPGWGCGWSCGECDDCWAKLGDPTTHPAGCCCAVHKHPGSR